MRNVRMPFSAHFALLPTTAERPHKRTRWLRRLATLVASISLVTAAISGSAHADPNPAPAAPYNCLINGLLLAVYSPCGYGTRVPDIVNSAQLDGHGYGGLFTATPEQKAALLSLQDSVISDTIQARGLRQSDYDSVKANARGELQSQMFSQIYSALSLPPGNRTDNQQAWAFWMQTVNHRLQVRQAEQAGREYMKWAGINPATFNSLVSSPQGGTADELRASMAADPQKYNNANRELATAGWCVYRAPEPYADLYTGYLRTDCNIPCADPLGCGLPTPPFEEFVAFGSAVELSTALERPDVSQVAVNVGRSLAADFYLFGPTTAKVFQYLAKEAVYAAKLAEKTAQGAVKLTTLIGQAAIEGAQAVKAAAAALEAAEVALKVAGRILMVIDILAAIALAVLEAYLVARDALIPTNIADLITQARSAPIEQFTESQQNTYLWLFLASVSPDPAIGYCDNTLRFGNPDEVRAPCLNAPPPPDPSASTDPTFLIDGSATPVHSLTLAVQNRSVESRVSGPWFIKKTTFEDGTQVDSQSLRTRYEDPAHAEHTIGVYHDANGDPYFRDVRDYDTADDPAVFNNCVTDGHCITTTTIHYLDLQGNSHVATIAPAQDVPSTEPQVSATASAYTIAESQPISFDAHGVSPTGLSFTYSWKFSKDASEVTTQCLLGFDYPACLYTDPVAGATVTHTFEGPGNYTAIVTATDTSGHTAEARTSVSVVGISPTLTTDPEASNLLGEATTVGSTLAHTGIHDSYGFVTDWGDGTVEPGSTLVGTKVENSPEHTVSVVSPTTANLVASHTYSQPGDYTVATSVLRYPLFDFTTAQNITQVHIGPPTIRLTGSPAVPKIHQTVTYEATVTGAGPNGTVTFTDENGVLCGPVSISQSLPHKAICTKIYQSVVSTTVHATFTGPGNVSLISGALRMDVFGDPTTTTLIASSTTPQVGEAVTYTGIVNEPFAIGTMTFKEGSTVLCPAAQVNNLGQATCTVTYDALGPHQITAFYNGDSVAEPSSSTPLTVTVSLLPTTTTLSGPSTGRATEGLTFTVSVAASSPAGVVTVHEGSTSLCGNQQLHPAGSTHIATCFLRDLSVGTHTLIASYGGDSRTAPSESAPFTVTISRSVTTTALTDSGPTSAPGQAVAYTATVAPSLDGLALGGLVDFVDGSTVVCAGVAVNPNGNSATCTTTYATAGAHSVVARYLGDANSDPSESAAATVSVKFPTSITLDVTHSTALPGQQLSYSMVVSAPNPTGRVTLTDNGVQICDLVLLSLPGQFISACNITYPNEGTHTLAATYAGDGSTSASSSNTITVTVARAVTNTTLSTSSATPLPNAPVTYTATVDTGTGNPNPTGTISFSDGATIICPSAAVSTSTPHTATCTQTYPTVGSHSIQASYSGGLTTTASASAVVPVTVTKAVTTTTLTAPATAYPNQAVTYSATITSAGPAPTGTVTFTEGVTAVCANAAITANAGSYTATCVQTYATEGSHTLTAGYNGATQTASSLSAPKTASIAKATTTTTLSAPATALPTQSLTYTATVTSTGPAPTGTVTFAEGSTAVCANVALTASGSTYTASCSKTYSTEAPHTLKATYNGNAQNNVSTSAAVTVTVARAVTTTAVSSAPAAPIPGQLVTYTATISGSGPAPTGTVTFTDATTTICNAKPITATSPYTATCTQTYNTVGTHSIKAAYSGSTLSAPSTSAIAAVTVVKAPTATSLTTSNAGAMFGQAMTFTAGVAASTAGIAGPTVGGSVSFTVDGNPVGSAVNLSSGSATSASVTGLSYGNHTVVATYSGDTNYLTSAKTITQTISCTQVLTAGSGTNYNVGSGASLCVVGGTLTGSVNVQSGGSLDLEGVTVQSSVNVGAALSARMCNTHITGSVSVGGGPINFGDPTGTACAGNTIDGSLNIQSSPGSLSMARTTIGGSLNVGSNTGGVLLQANTVSGSMNVGNNTGTKPVTVAGNRVLQSLSCASNTPVPTNAGLVNIVTGTATGQCLNLSAKP